MISLIIPPIQLLEFPQTRALFASEGPQHDPSEGATSSVERRHSRRIKSTCGVKSDRSNRERKSFDQICEYEMASPVVGAVGCIFRAKQC